MEESDPQKLMIPFLDPILISCFFFYFHRHLSLVKLLFVTISLKLYLKNYFLISLPLSLLASVSLIC